MTAPASGILFYEGRAKPLSTVGLIQPGSYYQFYLTGTLTLTNVYADGNLVTPLSQVPGTGGTTAASDGRLVPIYLNPAITYRYQLYSATNQLLEDIDPYLPSSVPTQAQLGQILYPQTAAEIAASVTPVNYIDVPGDPRRYGADPTGGNDSTTAIQSAINQHIQGGPKVLLYPGTYTINASLNLGNQTLLYSGLQFLGVGLPTITCTNLTVPIFTFGGVLMEISGIKLQYSSLPTNTQINAVAIRCYNLAWSRIDRIYATNVYGLMDQYPGSVASTGVNFFFSNWCTNLLCLTFSGWAINLTPFVGGNSGSVFEDIYINNSVNGVPSGDAACFGGVTLSTNNDSVWNQINIEWCRNSQSLITLTACGNISFNALHLEGNYPSTAFTGLIDVIEGGGGIGGTPTFNGITIAGNDWTNFGGTNHGSLLRSDFNGNGNRIIVRGVDCHNNTTPANMQAFSNIGSSCFGSTIEFESVADLDGSLSSNSYTPKANFGTVTAGVGIPLVRWNQMVRKQSATVTDNAGGTATAVFSMTGTNPNGTDADAMGLWSSASTLFVTKQSGNYLATVNVPTGSSPTVVVKVGSTTVATMVLPAAGGVASAPLGLVGAGSNIAFVLASGSYTRTGVIFGISLDS